ncbi:plasmid pRiA4b ORF-3 family protein, partial [Mediterraneibacter sp. 210702-DFI.5.30]|uniref:plasmid pRiA4b ORF-3 family protein n=1 Tax=Mediterraneibacter sp. 210702-DFI.5.30 TaxID=2883232 RepID=UPI001D07E793|nr:plasmid pRiA4b ORF-3 family protein [Mediterraneibacter sp. 210702-DFI.5.30]
EFLFRYDFGDGWEIKLKIEQLDDQNELSAKNLPRIIVGKGFGIVENVGGVDALKEFGGDLKHSDDQLND